MKNSDFIPNGNANDNLDTNLNELLHTDKCTTCPLILAARKSGEPMGLTCGLGGYNLSDNVGEGLKIPRMETITKTADIFGVPVHFVRAKVNSGEVVAVRAGKKFLVNVDKFAEYLNSATIQPEQEPCPSRLEPIKLR